MKVQSFLFVFFKQIHVCSNLVLQLTSCIILVILCKLLNPKFFECKITWIKLTLHGLWGAGIKEKKFIKHLVQIWHLDDVGYTLFYPNLNPLRSYFLNYVTIIGILCRLNEMTYKLSKQQLAQLLVFTVFQLHFPRYIPSLQNHQVWMYNILNILSKNNLSLIQVFPKT